MIKFESNMLVLDAPISKEDAQAVQEFAKHVGQEELKRLFNLLDQEQARTGLGFIQYKRILEISGYQKDAS